MYHTLITTNKSSLENNFIEFMNKNFGSEVKERINHVLFLMTKLENKITNKERKEITSKLKDLLKEYVESRKRKVYKKIIERIVEITNKLYDLKKQHTKFLHDQSYFGLKRMKDLFELEEDEHFTSVLMRRSFNGTFKEYEISGSTKVITFEEYLNKIKPSLKSQLEELQKSTRS